MFRESHKEVGIIYEYVPGRGVIKVELTREDYLKQLEEDALKRTQEYQAKLLAEGKELPPDAIKVV